MHWVIPCGLDTKSGMSTSTDDLEDQLRHLLRRGPLTSFQDASDKLTPVPPAPKPSVKAQYKRTPDSGRRPGDGPGFSEKEKKILE